MKKKNFFSGFNAKLALTAVALTGALLTGCYKDDGLDASTPTGTTELPAAVYTITGTVIDGETMAPISGITVSADKILSSKTVANGGFSYSSTDDGVIGGNTYTFSFSGNTYYEAGSASVAVTKLNAGESGVYPVLLALQPTYNGTYNLNLVETSGLTIDASEYTIQQGETSVSAPLSAGTYLITVTKEGYKTNYTTVELPKLRTDADTETKTVYVTLVPEEEEEVGTVHIRGELKMNGSYYSAKSIKIYSYENSEKGELLGINEGYTYDFEVSEAYFTEVATRAEATTTNKTATFYFEIVDQDEVTIAYTKEYTITTSGQGGSTSDADVTINFQVGITASDPVTVQDEATTVTIDICNDDETSGLPFTITYTKKEGTVVAESDYEEVLSGAGMTSGNTLYDLIEAGLTPEASSEYTTTPNSVWNSKTDAGYVIPVNYWLQTVDVAYSYTQISYEVSSITITAEGAELTEYPTAVIGASSKLNTANGIVVDNYVLDTVSHSHSHGHGHGDNQNAGGGILESE
ncbi:MAG: PEGA domain-containing protein [Bacteroides sp.]|nr:PEGA domain-containing protein [Bacteroides sp.]